VKILKEVRVITIEGCEGKISKKERGQNVEAVERELSKEVENKYRRR